MGIELRGYQRDACDAVGKAWQAGHKRVLLELGPGAGKSFICAEMCRRALLKLPQVLVLCHQQEILKQNLSAFELLTGERGSLYCEGLGEKDLSGTAVFAHRDSFHLCKEKPRSPFVIIDEAHMLSQRKTSKYQMILDAIGCQYLVGLTATPYRLQGGKIYGKGKPFDVRGFNLGIKALIERGSLCPYEIVEDDPQVIVGESKSIDYDAIGAKACQDAEIARSVELIRKHTEGLKCVLIYCCSIRHAEKVASTLGECALITGGTPQKLRELCIEKLRNGHIRYCANVNVLTTGTDIPRVDGIVMLRPTLSASLYIQAIGRGLRPHPDKKKLRVVELTDNLVRFGDLNDPMQYGKEREKEADELTLGNEAPKKECPGCSIEVAAPTRVCPHCDYLFLKKREEFSDEEILDLAVESYQLKPVRTKAGDDAFIVEFRTELGKIVEWLNINNSHQWIAQLSIAKLSRLRREKVKSIRVRGIMKRYPKILTYHT